MRILEVRLAPQHSSRRKLLAPFLAIRSNVFERTKKAFAHVLRTENDLIHQGGRQVAKWTWTIFGHAIPSPTAATLLGRSRDRINHVVRAATATFHAKTQRPF